MSDSPIEFKGSAFTLSVLYMKSSDLEAVKQQLAIKIKQAPQFFNMAPLVINVARLNDPAFDFAALKAMLTSLQLIPVGISGASDEQKGPAKAAGFACLSESKTANTVPEQEHTQIRYERVEVPVEVEVPVQKPSQVLRQNLRSGQQFYARDSDLVIIGTVSNGAEVIADGSIHIYGSLRGRAIAGAKGDDSAKIFAQKIEAELVSINGHYWTSEQIDKSFYKSPGCIALDGDKLTLTKLEV
ncbi:septum site-determining protein MinC [Gayadomonas joobiniege]|uniref:septum site-determining protein MinC n=1 Tax=Gayadomonas joobiniege TaxID=1234606 RepID=UPI0004748DA2|nr:septum site-determining protein MinC [Gayadomonas joobiniege]